MKLPQLSSSDQDRARIVLLVIGTLCVISVVLVIAVIVLSAIHEAVPTELWTLTTSIVTAMVALLVKVSSTTDTTPTDPVPVTVADTPVPVEVAPSTSSASSPVTDSTPSTGLSPSGSGSGFAEPYQPEDSFRLVPAPPRQQPTPYPQTPKTT